jgi:hypothetical protein
MTPKEKAIELYNKFYGIPLYIKTIKQCCNIVVNEILNDMTIRLGLDKEDFEYWEEVKQEIEKL